MSIDAGRERYARRLQRDGDLSELLLAEDSFDFSHAALAGHAFYLQALSAVVARCTESRAHVTRGEEDKHGAHKNGRAVAPPCDVVVM